MEEKESSVSLLFSNFAPLMFRVERGISAPNEVCLVIKVTVRKAGAEMEGKKGENKNNFQFKGFDGRAQR